MKFNKKLLQGTLIKRYKRFFADIKYKNKTVITHCPNSGSMLGLIDKGNKVWFSASNNPKRKLKYTLEIIEVRNKNVIVMISGGNIDYKFLSSFQKNLK